MLEAELLNEGGGGLSSLLIPHRARHSSVPQFAPVPMSGMLLLVLLLTSNPKAAFSSSNGIPMLKTWLRLVVPASALLKAEMRIASSQARNMLVNDP